MAANPLTDSVDVSPANRAEGARGRSHWYGNLPRFGFNVIGYASGNFGMGVAARHFIRLLLELGQQVAVLDIDRGSNQDCRNRTYADITVAHARDLPYAINVIMLNLVDLPEFFMTPPDGLFREDRINAGLIWWELTVLADRWVEAFRLFDVVLAGSDFMRHVVEFNVPGVRVIPTKLPVYLPVGPFVRDRQRFGLPEDPVLFLSSFDSRSCVERKNPFASLAAFKQAFPDRNDRRANLIFKINSSKNPSDGECAFVKDLREQCKDDDRLIVIAETLSDRDLLHLYASCDVYLSLHRSEGLGLGPLEAMRLGRPVIATGWSGNLTYMNHSNACLVSYRLIAAGGHQYYMPKFLGKAGFWADPDVAEAAQWMKVLVERPELRARFGKRAFESIVIYQADAETAGFLNEIHAIFDQHGWTGARSGPRYQNLAPLRKAVQAHRLSLLSAPSRFLKRATTTLERHVLWRFK